MYLVFEVGGTKTRIGFSSDGRNLESSQILSTPQAFDQFLPILKETATTLSKGQVIKAVCGGLAGVLNGQKTILVNAAHLPGWIGQPIKETLDNSLALTFLENDAALGALGEATNGSGVDKTIVAYITIGTGIGGARVVNGKLDNKALGFEPGHQIISPSGLEWEQFISGPALEKEYGKPTDQINDPQIWDEAAKRVALGLANTIMLWSPDIVILGGGLMQKIPLERIRLHLKTYLKVFPTPPEIALSKLDELSGLHGALLYLRQNQDKPQ